MMKSPTSLPILNFSDFRGILGVEILYMEVTAMIALTLVRSHSEGRADPRPPPPSPGSQVGARETREAAWRRWREETAAPAPGRAEREGRGRDYD